ncbi:hypothetical protein L6452_12833 [Arctium lappa]|uniref:Uncharacterized protein n=1 Tax=Arctium lappa TaxID=4217 RepID=A0ACB9CGK6_ARCLA|nr:hypothetical protein L6452_12833 [Arctium lappa]
MHRSNYRSRKAASIQTRKLCIHPSVTISILSPTFIFYVLFAPLSLHFHHSHHTFNLPLNPSIFQYNLGCLLFSVNPFY